MIKRCECVMQRMSNIHYSLALIILIDRIISLIYRQETCKVFVQYWSQLGVCDGQNEITIKYKQN